jgi:hypothetical protein
MSVSCGITSIAPTSARPVLDDGEGPLTALIRSCASIAELVAAAQLEMPQLKNLTSQGKSSQHTTYGR